MLLPWRRMLGFKPRLVGTTLVAALECAALTQFILALAYVSDWHLFVASNETAWSTRLALAGATVGTAAAGGLGYLLASLLKPAWSGALERVRTLALPLLALWPLPTLLFPGVFAGAPFAVLSVALGVGLGTEFTLGRALPLGGRLTSLLARRSRAYDVLVVLLTVLFCSWTGFASIRVHDKILSSNFDLGLFENLFWNTLHGRHGWALDRAYFGEHAELFLYPMLPFYWLFPRPETLLVIQAILVGGAALPFYLLARRWLGATFPAFVLAVAYLAYPSVHGPLFYDFHFLALSPFFILWAAYFFVTRRYKLLAASVFFALTCREDVALGLTLIATVLVALRVQPRVSSIIGLVALAWFVATKLLWMPTFIKHTFTQHYEHLMPKGHEGFGGMALTLASNPSFVLSTLVSEQKLLLALHLLAPLSLLPLRQRRTVFFVLPGFIIVGLALSTSAIVEFKFHYTCHFIPYLFIASAIALAVRKPVPRGAAACGVLLASLILTVQFGAFVRRPYPASFRDVSFEWTERDAQRLADLQRLIEQIPDDAKVATSEYEGAHVARRTFLRAIKIGIGRADHILYGPDGLHKSSAKYIEEVLEDKSFGVVDTSGEFTLLRLGASTKSNRRVLRELRRTGILEGDNKRRM